MPGLFGRTWKDSYKQLIILGDAAWTGVPATPVRLKDGAGTVTPLYIGVSALKVHTGQKLYFGDNEDKYIFNSTAQILNITAPRVRVTGTLQPEVLSAAVIKGVEAQVTTVAVANITATDTVRGAIVSGTTIKGTNITATGRVSAASIKGDIVIPSGGNVRLTDGAVIFKTGTHINLSGNYMRFVVSGITLALLDTKTFYPNAAGYDLGKNAPTGRWQNLYVASILAKRMDVSMLNAYGGTASLTTIRNTTFMGRMIHAVSRIVASGCSIFLDGSRTYSIRKDGTLIRFAMGTTILNINASNAIYPNTTNTGEIGTPVRVFNTLYVRTVNAIAHLRVEGTMNAKYLPVTSTGLGVGDVYRSGGNLKVVV